MELKPESPTLKSLRELVSEASLISPTFKNKYDYWIRRRRISPDWLLPQLAAILGRARIEAELEKLI